MIVSTAQGQLEGIERHGVLAVPGHPVRRPAGRRAALRPPAPPVPWEGVRAAAQFGAVARQTMGGTAMLLGDQGRARDLGGLPLPQRASPRRATTVPAR